MKLILDIAASKEAGKFYRRIHKSEVLSDEAILSTAQYSGLLNPSEDQPRRLSESNRLCSFEECKILFSKPRYISYPHKLDGFL